MSSVYFTDREPPDASNRREVNLTWEEAIINITAVTAPIHCSLDTALFQEYQAWLPDSVANEQPRDLPSNSNVYQFHPSSFEYPVSLWLAVDNGSKTGASVLSLPLTSESDRVGDVLISYKEWNLLHEALDSLYRRAELAGALGPEHFLPVREALARFSALHDFSNGTNSEIKDSISEIQRVCDKAERGEVATNLTVTQAVNRLRAADVAFHH